MKASILVGDIKERLALSFIPTEVKQNNIVVKPGNLLTF